MMMVRYLTADFFFEPVLKLMNLLTGRTGVHQSRYPPTEDDFVASPLEWGWSGSFGGNPRCPRERKKSIKQIIINTFGPRMATTRTRDGLFNEFGLPDDCRDALI